MQELQEKARKCPKPRWKMVPGLHRKLVCPSCFWLCMDELIGPADSISLRQEHQLPSGCDYSERWRPAQTSAHAPGLQEFTHHSQIQRLINLEIYVLLIFNIYVLSLMLFKKKKKHFSSNPRSWGCTQQQWWSEFPQWTSKPGPAHKCCIGFLFDMF